MTENQLSLVSQVQGLQQYDDGVFEDVAKAGDYIQRIQLFGGNTGAVKKKQVPMDSYAIVIGKDKYDVLGPQIDLIPVAWRPKVLDTTNKEGIVALFDPNDPEFKRIKMLSDTKDSGCMFGPEFLVWVPSRNKFCAMFFSSKSMRMVAEDMREPTTDESGKTRNVLGYPRTLTVETVERGKYIWSVPKIVPTIGRVNEPTPEQLLEAVTKFNAETKAGAESAPSDERVR